MVAVCTPTRDTLLAGFTFDLVELVKYTPEASFYLAQGSILPNLRALLARTAMQNNATHVLFIDSDMRFPKDTVERLAKHNKPVIGANCSQRTQVQTTARKNDEFVNSKGQRGIEEVESVGMGVTLINMSVFRQLKEPWFSMPWDGKKHVGEDVFFCKFAREHGFQIFIDHDLSHDVKHAGLIEFGI